MTAATVLNQDDIIRVVITTRTAGQQGLNVRLVKVGLVVGGTVTLADLAAGLSSEFHTLYKDAMSDDSQWEALSCRRIDPDQTLEVFNLANAGNGNVVAAPLPKNTAPVITYYTDYPGPGGRGRNYFPFLADDFMDADGTLDAAGTTLMNAIKDKWLGGLTVIDASGGSVTVAPGIVYSKTGQWRPFTSGAVYGKFGSVRRRGDYPARKHINPAP